MLFSAHSHAHIIGCCRRAIGVVALVLGVALTPAAAQSAPGAVAAPTRTISFTGAVFSDSGHPLAGATVTVVGRAASTVTTNSEGFFIMPLTAGQPVRFLVAFPGHTPEQVELRAPKKRKTW
ncbi:carboxypeptidase-like regulatory domain-containing protein [Hymenobacter sp. 5516J-16]|uniref:carboxypeptidase-like regulatory domain-containing protein n=1 Tax=Hymenobacter sp. 5516J-16 TaxID=2932253 RepID=UPI001FD02C8B|nr:carboxypeptidase-like regulatory domain-containing protein [Hymenobacter sp. 5516J-16]UOQ78955.1 carboxypeptidase-like regulatory domain-containing protein [Hymenobacter sp. 5516J-16]